MSKPVVAVKSYKDPYQSLKEALELCSGFEDFNKKDKILIKPNLVAWDFELPYPPFGVITTSELLFALVEILYERGFRNLTIGEAPLNVPKTMGREIFKKLGYEKLKDKYGVELVDFNEDKFEKVEFDFFSLSLAQKALEADKIINMPVLKTHNQAKVSLGLKNLKGCLNRQSKMRCHSRDVDLNYMFPYIIEKLPVTLTIIDGVFTLAKGPGHFGKAYRKNLIIASKNALACDVVGAELMGYKAGEVEHLKFFAGRHGLSTDLGDIEIRGEELEKHRSSVEYDWEWTEENTMPAGFHNRGISGLAVRKYDNTLCTGCSMMYNPMLILLMSAYKGKPFPGVEILSGKRQKASPGFEYTVLFGKCACDLNKDNPHIKNAVPIKGCPPSFKQLEEGLQKAGISCDYNEYVKYRHYIYGRYKKEDGFDLGLYVK